MPEPDEDCCNYMGISLLRSLSGVGIGRLQACLPLFPAGSHRVVLLRPAGLLMWLNSLTVNVLNIVYMFCGVMDIEYLCVAKVPYYGRSAYRHRAHDNAGPLRDATGSRGIFCKERAIVRYGT